MTLKISVMAAEKFSFAIHRNNLEFTNLLKKIFLIFSCNNISQYYCFCIFWSNKCSLDEHEDFFEKHVFIY